jgi:hypothetical protein
LEQSNERDTVVAAEKQKANLSNTAQKASMVTPPNKGKVPTFFEGIATLAQQGSAIRSEANMNKPRTVSRNTPTHTTIDYNITKLDKAIILKQGQKRTHIHRYDIRLHVQSHKDPDDFKIIRQVFQKLFELLVQADGSIITPPYFELESEDKKAVDLLAKFQVSELDSILALKRYLSRLSKIQESGFIYCNVIIAHNLSFYELMDKTRQIFNDLKYGLFLRASDHEDSAEVGWLLYSTKFQDPERLAHLLSSLCKENVGVKWRPIRTNDRYRKEKTNGPAIESTNAMHIEAAANKVIDIRRKLATWYSTSSRTFPDGTKLRLVPPFQSIMSFTHKTKYAALVARQAALTSKIGSASCYEFAANLILDRPAPDTRQTLRQYLLSIPSVNFPSTPMFHTVDRSFRSDTGITFSFHPENATHAHSLIAGLLCYMRDYANPWFMRFLLPCIPPNMKPLVGIQIPLRWTLLKVQSWPPCWKPMENGISSTRISLRCRILQKRSNPHSQ